ncbi:MAG: 50S ribosomal protein L2 [Candidatus Woesearchaeota archaeon]
MGKNLTQQKRGKGSFSYRARSHRFKGESKYHPLAVGPITGVIKDIVHCAGHSSPVIEVVYEDKTEGLLIAPAGVQVGDVIVMGSAAAVKVGNTLPLKSIPEGTLICNVESQPGDGGKFVRSSGVTAKVLAKTNDKVVIELPSKKQKELNPNCRAMIGMVAGAGRREKPFLKAGNRYHRMKAKGKYYPLVTAQAMNAVDHPYGGSRSSRKGRPTIAPRFAPPGRKVGMLSPRRTGGKKGK